MRQKIVKSKNMVLKNSILCIEHPTSRLCKKNNCAWRRMAHYVQLELGLNQPGRINNINHVYMAVNQGVVEGDLCNQTHCWCQLNRSYNWWRMRL